MTISNENRVSSAVVPEELRLAVLPNFLGRHSLTGESLVYDWAARLGTEYQGGLWHYFTLSNGGFYMAPANLGLIVVHCDMNGYNDTMGSDAFGVVVTLFALCRLGEMTRDDTVIDRFHQLRDFAVQHMEAARILRAID